MRHNWNYNEENYSKDGFTARELLPEGEYQVKIESVDFMTAASGKEMYVIKLKTLEEKYDLRFFLVINEDNPTLTDQSLGSIFDSFQIPAEPEDLRADTDNWVDRWGAVEVAHRFMTSKRSGDEIKVANVKRFLPVERQKELGWVIDLNNPIVDAPVEPLPF